jgi:N6-L-threonylcarbamoyladenine synthase
VIHRTILTLAIESSCDDTAVAIVEKNGPKAILHFNEKITANNAHLRGIHPIVALESHEVNLAGLVQKAMHHLPTRLTSSAEASNQITHRDKLLPNFISVTRGPGMRSNLSTGLSTAKGLAAAWGIPLIGVHHMQAHALTSRLAVALQTPESYGLHPTFPFLSLLVSGGHTLLVRSDDLAKHEVLATTGDIAIGDCLDKAARSILPEQLLSSTPHTSYGSFLESFAFPQSKYDYDPPATRAAETQSRPTSFGWKVPTPLANTRTMRFSFSGIDSSVRRIVSNGYDSTTAKTASNSRTEPISVMEARLLARETMRSAFEHLSSRVIMALESEETPSKTLVVGGGVAANGFLKHILTSFLTVRGYPNVQIMVPPASLCTDNAAMIGWAGCEMFENGFQNSLDIRALPKWGIENIAFPEKEEQAQSWIEREAHRQV